MLEKFDHLTTLACFAQAQPLRRVRVSNILLGKGGEGGVGGNRWQVANANGNSLTIRDLLWSKLTIEPIPCKKGKEKRWKSIWRVMMAFECNWLGVKLIRQSPGFSTARKKSKYKATDRWDQDQIWPKNWNKNNLQHASPVQCSATVFVQVNKWLRSGGGLDENNEKAFRRSLRHSPCH